jgi:glycogen operon protein
MLHPRTIQLIMDSLRYWVLEMHVDGFRFDLASALARELHEVDRLSAFFDIIHQDPVLSQVKLIAEPWDVGEGGYQVGNFPVLWAEWNGRYRDCVRRFWRGDRGQVAELAYRLTGSSDLYAQNGRRPSASINFVTAHDGFSLRDLVSYDEKHNEANGEANRDGENHNLSWNCGVEGETADGEVRALRLRQMRNFLTTLFVSQGVPMLLSGDELARTQGGNNNAYCQDNPISWMPWEWTAEQRAMLEWTRGMIALRADHNILRRRNFFHGQPIRGAGTKDVQWLRPDGTEMAKAQWRDEGLRCLGVYESGEAADVTDETGQPIVGDSLLILLNAQDAAVDFRLPSPPLNRAWTLVLDTAAPADAGAGPEHSGGAVYRLAPRALAILTHPPLAALIAERDAQAGSANRPLAAPVRRGSFSSPRGRTG